MIVLGLVGRRDCVSIWCLRDRIFTYVPVATEKVNERMKFRRDRLTKSISQKSPYLHLDSENIIRCLCAMTPYGALGLDLDLDLIPPVFRSACDGDLYLWVHGLI